MYEPEEFHRLLAIYNEYPIRELIIHPRTRQEFYKEKIHPEIFKYAYEHSKNPITFNGEIRSLQAVTALEKEYPAMKNIMIGRGLIAKPGFIMQAADGSLTENRTRSKKRLKEFLDCLLEEYRKVMSADIHALFKMKEIWIYMAPYFTNYVMHSMFGVSLRALPSSVWMVSPSRAVCTMICLPPMHEKSKACMGWPYSSMT